MTLVFIVCIYIQFLRNTSPMVGSQNRTRGIDSARALAIIGVVLVHSKIFDNGRFGVQLFFLISGYLLVDMGQQTGPAFLIRRAFRLFPLFWMISIFFYHDSLGSIPQILISAALLQNVVWSLVQIPGAWSISNEWIYSLILPGLRRISKRALITAIATTWGSQVFISYYVYAQGLSDSPKGIWLNTLNPYINFPFLLIGIGLNKRFIPILKNGWVVMCICVITEFSSLLTGHNLIFIWPITLWAIFSFCVQNPPRNAILSSVLSFIGQRTYGIFFLHFLFLDYAWKLPYFKEIGDHFEYRRLLLFLLVMLCSCACAEFTWRLIERPAIKIGRKLTSRELQRR